MKILLVGYKVIFQDWPLFRRNLYSDCFPEPKKYKGFWKHQWAHADISVFRHGKLICIIEPGGFQHDDIILEHLEIAGSCIGIGHWRPSAPSCGNYGRFAVEKVE